MARPRDSLVSCHDCGGRALIAVAWVADHPDEIAAGANWFWAKVNKVKPNADANGAPHSGFKTDENGKVTGYTEFDENGNEVKRFRGVGGTHGGMEPPLIYGPVKPGARVNRSRTPTPDELPAGY